MAMDDAAGTDRRRLEDLERALREAQHDLRALHHRLAELERDRDRLRAAFRVVAFAGMEGQRTDDLEKAS